MHITFISVCYQIWETGHIIHYDHQDPEIAYIVIKIFNPLDSYNISVLMVTICTICIGDTTEIQHFKYKEVWS